MKLLILISTYGPEALQKVSRQLLPPREAVVYLVSWQTGFNERTPATERQAVEAFLTAGPLALRDDVIVSVTDGRGLSANRNRSLEMAAEWCRQHGLKAGEGLMWLMDDDVRLLEEGIDRIIDLFGSRPALDGATFRIRTPEGQDYKPYASREQALDRREALRQVSSIEIVLRQSSVERAGVRFDERFGLGARWICSEEFLFLDACRRCGLQLRSFPVSVAVHPKNSSVNGRSPYEKEMLETAGAVNAVLYDCPGAYLRNFASMFKARLPLKKRLWLLRTKNRAAREALKGRERG